MTESSTIPPPTVSGAAIDVDHLTKRFILMHRGGSLKRELLGAVKKIRSRPAREEFTALNDISFSIPHGQTVAVIGRNGSGKSTLLGILARVYRPTAGSLRLLAPGGTQARIAPLLALDSGFHPDLTGLENIEFYGAVLGMSSKLIKERTDDIVEFAELEAKVDTLVRGWNDGAKLRLGFSIAVHTDPDILLVDEVLAVGDESFQNKCYRLIADLQRRGKTILFVSHDLNVVERVASRVIWLNRGVIEMDGEVHAVLAAYRTASERSE
jgi:ABC-type polysaccharide/polyol phosphate transport system ATPase subunit